jgi:hypothetical protein
MASDLADRPVLVDDRQPPGPVLLHAVQYLLRARTE